MKKTMLASTGALTAALVAVTGVGTAFAQYPGYADLNRDGIVTATEYQNYAFERADTDDDHSIDANERVRYDRLMDLDQEF